MITIGAESREGEVAIIIQDDGCGMSESVRLRCLDPNACLVPKNGRLSGYGIVHGILDRHGGKIEIESKEGKGTRIVVILPSASKKETTAVAPVKPVETKKSLRILIADDEPMIREVLEMYLLEDNHNVESAADGREALEKFKKANYDVVLTDRSMPEMNGDELAAAVKKHRPNVPVVLLTGFGDLMKADGEKPEGVDAIISKPFTLDSLRGALANL